MIRLSSMLARDLPGTGSCRLRLVMIPAPRLRLLSSQTMRPSSFLASIILHVLAITLFLLLPHRFPAPVFILQDDVSNAKMQDEPLILPELPPLRNESSVSTEQKPSGSRAARDAAIKKFSAPTTAPDFTAPQIVISDVAKPVNRIQTIMRPDLVTAPNIKFPLRLQTVVILSSGASPVLAAPTSDEAAKPATPAQPATPAAEVAPRTRSVELPVLTIQAKHASVIRSKAAAARSASPNLGAVSRTQPNALKALVVLNAVNVTPDFTVPVPEAQLGGKFVVGPSREVAGPKAPAVIGGTEHDPRIASISTAAGADRPSSVIASGGPDSAREGRELSGSPKLEAGRGTEAATGGEITIAGSTHGGVATGISISGGISGSNRVTISRALSRTPSYPLMVISGGSSGGASRDLGVFSRTETVYSVSIPMADAGGGPDWTLQYALLNPVQAGAGLLVPPLARKKCAAAMKASPASTDAGPVFVSAVIDENGKMQSPKSIHPADPRSQVALSTLAQWEFLPAQLEGKPVASKILLGIAVIAME